VSAVDAPPPAPPFRLAAGAVRQIAAEALLLPTGLVTAAVLTRALGPAHYGLFSLAATLVGGVAWTVTSLFARAAVKFVAEADDWRPVALSVLRWRLLGGAISAGAVLLAAGPLAAALGEPDLAPALRLFSLDLVLFGVVRAYREVLVGTGRFHEQAVVTTVRWLVRMGLMVALVAVFRSVEAAVWGSIATTAVELAVAMRYVRLPWRGRGGVAARQLWAVAAPLLLFGLCLQLVSRLDLFALKALGGTATDAGYYGAAQNLAVGPGLFALAFSPLLLATLGRLGRDGHADAARALGRQAMRLTWTLLPLVGVVAGTSHEIVGLVMGPDFAPAAPLVVLLFAAAAALAAVAVAASVLAAADRPGLASAVGVGMLAVALVGYAVLIPERGALGAAAATAIATAFAAIVGAALVHTVWRASSTLTALRGIVLAVAAGAVGTLWHAPGLWVVAELLVLTAGCFFGLVALGEVSADERAQLRAWVRQVRHSKPKERD